MAQISKRNIDKALLFRINEILYDLFLNMTDKQEIESVLNELLTYTEKTMIAKRVACFFRIG